MKTEHPRQVRVALIFSLSLALACLIAYGQQPLTKTEKLEQKVRIGFIQSTAGINAPTIKADSLKARWPDTNLILVDVRNEEEQRVSMLPGAYTPTDFAIHFRVGGVPHGKTVVTYCTIGFRSGKFAEQLIQKGIHAVNLEGGVLAWSLVGGHFITHSSTGDTVATNKVHVYAKEWNLLAPGYEAIW